MNTFPKELNIFSKIFKIKYVTNVLEVDKEEEAYLYGQVDFDTNTIRVLKSENRGQADVWHILIHEIIHIIIQNMGTDFKKDTEEKIIDSLAVGISDTLLRNNLLKK